MEELKKGELLLKKMQKTYSFNVSICDGMICDYCKEFYDFYKRLPEKSQKLLDNGFSNLKNEIQDSNILELLSEYCKGIDIDTESYPIIYKEFKDENGNSYGEELLTSKVFPIPKEVHDNFTVTYIKRKDDLFHGSGRLNPHHIYHESGISSEGCYMFSDNEGHRYYTDSRKKLDSYSINDAPVNSFFTGTIVKAPVICYEITLSLDYIHDNANRLEVALEGHDYANQQEVNSYRARNIIVRHISRKVKKLFNLNTFKVDFYPMETKDITTLLNEIETLLNNIKDVSEEMYKEAYDKYQRIINEENNAETDKCTELQVFYNTYSKKLSLPTDYKEACEFLDSYINTIIENIINGRFSNLTLDYITSIYEDFLKNQNDYSVKAIQEINNKFNLLWFLYLYNNRHEYDNSFYWPRGFDSSILAQNVNGVVNVVRKLNERGIVSCPKYVNRNHEQKTLEDLTELISKVEIENLERTKELIKE